GADAALRHPVGGVGERVARRGREQVGAHHGRHELVLGSLVGHAPILPGDRAAGGPPVPFDGCPPRLSPARPASASTGSSAAISAASPTCWGRPSTSPA